MMGRVDSAASAPLLEKTAAEASESGGGYCYVEGCPGCAVDRHKAANPGIPYSNFIYVWIVTLCTGTRARAPANHRHAISCLCTSAPAMRIYVLTLDRYISLAAGGGGGGGGA
jgi:hypothetical protein